MQCVVFSEFVSHVTDTVKLQLHAVRSRTKCTY